MPGLVKVATFFNPTEAHIFKHLLAEQGIESEIFDEQLQVLIPLPTVGVKLMVSKENLSRAREIIQELEQSGAHEIQQPEDEDA